MKKAISFLAIFSLIILLGAGCSANKKQNKQEKIKLGIVSSLTGAGSFYGQNIKKGVELAINEINKNGGVNGKKIKAIYEDDRTKPKKTVSAVKKLINVNNVSAIVGLQWDFLANPVIPIANRKGVPMISAGAPFDSLSEQARNSSYFYTTFPAAKGSIKAVRKFIQKRNVKDAVIISVNNSWGKAYVDAFKQALKKEDSELLDTIFLPKKDNNDLRTVLAKVEQKDSDSVIVVVNQADYINFVKRYRELDLEAIPLFHEKLAGFLESGKLTKKETKGVYFFDFPQPSKDFVNKFKNFHGKEPQIAAGTAYDAVYAIKKAIEGSDKATSKGISKGLQSVSFEGASGPIDFTESNYPQEKEAKLKKVTEDKVIKVE
ncbi:MAG: ABC transporter substrate-binding protein [Candidatus Magasanikbacteria bacterium]